MFKGIKMFTIISLRIYDYEQDAVCSFYKIVSTVLFKTIDNLKTVIRGFIDIFRSCLER